MAAQKTTRPYSLPPQYHIVDAGGQHVSLEAVRVETAKTWEPRGFNLRLGVPGGFAIFLDQTAASDLAAALSGFGSTGTLT
jgi:hypothetical protein